MKSGLVLVLVLWPAAAWAGPLSDVILAPGAFRATGPGQVTRYDTGDGAQLVVEAVEQGRVLAQALDEAGGLRPIAAFPASGADPVLLYFLESVTRDVAEATGGSPHYIRNRIREALGRAGLDGAGGATVSEAVRPFADDANRARLGPFAGLELRFDIAEGEPVQLERLSAKTDSEADGYARIFTRHMKDD